MTVTTPDTVSTLSYLGMVLQKSGYQTLFVAADENPEHPYEQLVVQIRQDKRGREVVVRLIVADEVVQAINRLKKEPTPRSYGSILQLFMPLLGYPPVPPALEADLDTLLNQLNNLIHLGLFGYNATDGIYFRYSFYFQADTLDPRLVEEMIFTMGFLIGKYRTYIDALLEGRAPLKAILEHLDPAVRKGAQ